MTMPMRDVTPIPKVKKARKKIRGRAVTDKEHAKEQATILHSLVVRARDGYRCRLCGATGRDMQCAHNFSRAKNATRTDEANAVCLCGGCHMRLTHNPHEHVEFFKHTVCGEAEYQRLYEKAYSGIGKRFPASFWQAEVERLTALLKEYGL